MLVQAKLFGDSAESISSTLFGVLGSSSLLNKFIYKLTSVSILDLYTLRTWMENF